jgi:hypothetical protein
MSETTQTLMSAAGQPLGKGVVFPIGRLQMTISVQLPDEAERRLAETAKRLNVPIQESAAATRVIARNRELYRPLA